MIKPLFSRAAALPQNDTETYSPFSHCQPARVDIENINWPPHTSKSLLESIDLCIEAGSFCAIVGPNGSGKTSLLRCLYRVNKPSSGQILLDGKNIWSLSAQQSAQRIATVLQDAETTFGLTVFEIIEIGLTPRSNHWRRTEQDNQRIHHAITLMDLSHLTHRSCDELSGGERQRVMIARALVQEPDVLILDEPTNHLDIRHQLEVLELLAKLPCTVIVSLHDLSLAAAYADKVVVMKEGKMEICQSPKQVFTEQRIKQVFDVDTIIDEHPITQRPRFSFYLNNQTG